MNLETLALGLVGIGFGSLLAIFGVRFFWILLTLWGAVLGFIAGAQVAAAVFGTGFLATVIGWICGLGGAILFGALAGTVYWAAVILLCAGVGWSIGSGLLVALGLEPGLVTHAAGLAGGAALVVLAIVFRVPVALVAILTAYAGTGYAIVGGLVVLGRVQLAELGGGVLAPLHDRPLALLAWLALGTVACAYQLVVASEDRQRLLGALDQVPPR